MKWNVLWIFLCKQGYYQLYRYISGKNTRNQKQSGTNCVSKTKRKWSNGSNRTQISKVCDCSKEKGSQNTKWISAVKSVEKIGWVITNHEKNKTEDNEGLLINERAAEINEAHLMVEILHCFTKMSSVRQVEKRTGKSSSSIDM